MAQDPLLMSEEARKNWWLTASGKDRAALLARVKALKAGALKAKQEPYPELPTARREDDGLNGFSYIGGVTVDPGMSRPAQRRIATRSRERAGEIELDLTPDVWVFGTGA